MNTPSTSPESPPPSTESPKVSTYCPRTRLFTITDKARATAGILTPTETLELVDLAEAYYNKLQETHDELESLEWDLSHPTYKDQ